MSTDTTANDEGKNEFSKQWRQLRACTRCRRFKKKCSFENPSFKSCARCFKNGYECSFNEDPAMQPSRKKKRKIQIDDNTHSSIANQLLLTSENTLKLLPEKLNDLSEDSIQHLISNYESIMDKLKLKIKPDTSNEFPYIPYSKNLAKELIYRYNYLTLAEVKTRLDFFLNEILPYYPTIPLSRKLKNFDYMLEKFPLLLIACIFVTVLNDNNLGTTPILKDNLKLCNLLSYYLYSFIAHEVYVKCEQFNIQLIYVCLILSSWCLPPIKLGHFRNQLNSLTASNIALCMGLNELPKNCFEIHLDEESELRNNLRALLSVYCSCGSLELSVRRFKVVTWTQSHQIAMNRLLETSSNQLPTLEDRYICYFAELVFTGHEILNFVDQINLAVNRSRISLLNIKRALRKYEQRLSQILDQSGFTSTKQALVLQIQYFHLLVVIYDNLVSGVFNQSDEITPNYADEIPSSNERQFCLKMIIKLITLCESLVDQFVRLNNNIINIPSVLYYRPMHALILLVRLRLILKFQNFKDIEIDVESYFTKVSRVINDNLMKNSLVCSKMKVVLNKIEKWLILSQKYIKSDSVENNGPMNFDVVKIIFQNKDKEIENLDVPKSHNESPIKTNTTIESQDPSPVNSVDNPFTANNEFNGIISLEQIFQGIDSDILHYLNPLESNFDLSTDFNRFS